VIILKIANEVKYFKPLISDLLKVLCKHRKITKSRGNIIRISKRPRICKHKQHTRGILHDCMTAVNHVTVYFGVLLNVMVKCPDVSE